MAERKVYVTRYWQTDGIQAVVVIDDAHDGHLWVRHCGKTAIVGKGDYAESLGAAKATVAKKALAKLKSLNKQKSKLSELLLKGVKVTEVAT